MGLKSFQTNYKQEAIMIVRTIESKNYLNFVTRVKYVEPSEKTEQFFTQLGQCLRRAVKPQAEVALTS